MVDFLEHLRRQMRFLERSATAYDQGFRDEVYRIAVALRVLLHDTKSSVSLLTHLNALPLTPLLSTTEPPPDTAVYYDGLSIGRIGDGEVSIGPALDGARHRRIIPAPDWWNEIVFVKDSARLSRRNITLAVANQDGGAHVDQKLDKDYADFKRAGFPLAWGDPSLKVDIAEPHLLFLRQMAYEILNSPALGDLAATGAVSPKNMELHQPRLSWMPPVVEPGVLALMTPAQITRLRAVVTEGHFLLLDRLYKNPVGASDIPDDGYKLDVQRGTRKSLGQWLRPLVSEKLIRFGSSENAQFQITMKGRAFVARIIDIGH